MGNIRGLRTRLCPKCTDITPRRTLYARTTNNGKRRWLQLFWACTRCGSLNDVVLPVYTLARAGFTVSGLALAVVDALEHGPRDLDELIASSRRSNLAGQRHVFAADLRLAIDLLRARGLETDARDLAEEQEALQEEVPSEEPAGDRGLHSQEEVQAHSTPRRGGHRKTN
jgi:hypothetical protein